MTKQVNDSGLSKISGGADIEHVAPKPGDGGSATPPVSFTPVPGPGGPGTGSPSADGDSGGLDNMVKK